LYLNCNKNKNFKLRKAKQKRNKKLIISKISYNIIDWNNEAMKQK